MLPVSQRKHPAGLQMFCVPLLRSQAAPSAQVATEMPFGRLFSYKRLFTYKRQRYAGRQNSAQLSLQSCAELQITWS